MSELKNRYDFVILFDVENGNPNGDPDAGNLPRTDAEIGKGIVTDVCIKRKIRNYVQTVKDDAPPYKIFIKSDMLLNDKMKQAFEAIGAKEDKKTNSDARRFMCDNYFDVRTFGAVMTTGNYNCGQVRGPVQLNFAKSIDSVFPSEITITRMAVTRKEDENKSNTMGKKTFVPYGLYKMEGYVSAKLANETGFSEEDLKLLFEAIENMFEEDHSAARGKMVVRKFIVFKHENILGNAHSHKLFDLINVKKKDDCEIPRSFKEDYEFSIDREKLPAGVELIERV